MLNMFTFVFCLAMLREVLRVRGDVRHFMRCLPECLLCNLSMWCLGSKVVLDPLTIAFDALMISFVFFRYLSDGGIQSCFYDRKVDVHKPNAFGLSCLSFFLRCDCIHGAFGAPVERFRAYFICLFFK